MVRRLLFEYHKYIFYVKFIILNIILQTYIIKNIKKLENVSIIYVNLILIFLA